MRPVRLTIQAFGPYPGREVIDFRDAVDAGLFGIYGQTGSGKSTIFSAMTFALFGEPAKIEQDAPSLRSDHADADVQTEVEFVFDIGERRFVVLRRPDQMRPKQRGEGETRSLHEAFLFDARGMAPDEIRDGQRGKVIAEKKVRDVDTAIVEILGYGPDQFRQIVLLPQGRFETFLSANTKDRLAILRDLFDVSLFRRLAERLKIDAETAERYVRQEREVCARRLAAEGFESTDTLATGITEAEAHHVQLLEVEEAARNAFAATQAALQTAEKIEAQFKAAEEAEKVRAELQANKATMDALASQIARAQRALLLIDTENHANAAAGEVSDGESALKQAKEASARAEDQERSATATLRKEAERVGEIDDLGRRIEDLGRHRQTIERAAGIRDAVEQAQAAERDSKRRFDEAQQRLIQLQNDRREKSEALGIARRNETYRREISTRLSALEATMTAAEIFEKSETEVQRAQTEIDKFILAHQAAMRHSTAALSAFEVAERELSHIQALHLASKLAPGEPCPVCGSPEHPAPATGAVEHSGLTQAFWDAEAVWLDADKTVRNESEKLTAARSVLQERQNRLADFRRPEERASAIRERVTTMRAELGALAPEIDLTEADAEIQRLAGEIEMEETARDALRDELTDLHGQTAAKTAQLDEMLTTVPENLRDSNALAVAAESSSRLLAERLEANIAAEKAATETREASLAARKDVQAADTTLKNSRDRHINAMETFRSRLQSADLTQEDYIALKPAIDTIDDDRERLDDYRRQLAIAEEVAKKAVDAVRDQTRSNLQELEQKGLEVEEKLKEATNQRAGAGHHRDQLTKLRDELAEVLRNLDEEEAASGPLRTLAAFLNGDNPQKLDIETFAIGAMFDQVLQAANLRLGPMTANRYQLERDHEGVGRGRRGLGIQAFDVHTGKPRATTTLSGGESFIAALALALGLADVVESTNGKVRLDTIFIDEGFGSLDTENGSGTLDQVLQVLSSLVRQNRAVGLISHVQLVQESIPNGFYVRKQLNGSSIETRRLV